MLVLLDDGRRRLVEYLTHRMEAAASPEEKVRAWIEGVLAQAADPDAAARTRPFVANEDRLGRVVPRRAAGLGRPAGRPSGRGPLRPRRRLRDPEQVHRDAEAVFRLTFATLQAHLIRGTRPTARERRTARPLLPAGCRCGGGGVTGERRARRRRDPGRLRGRPGAGVAGASRSGGAGRRPPPRARSPSRAGGRRPHRRGARTRLRGSLPRVPRGRRGARRGGAGGRGGVETARNVGKKPYLEVVIELKDRGHAPGVTGAPLASRRRRRGSARAEGV